MSTIQIPNELNLDIDHLDFEEESAHIWYGTSTLSFCGRTIEKHGHHEDKRCFGKGCVKENNRLCIICETPICEICYRISMSFLKWGPNIKRHE